MFQFEIEDNCASKSHDAVEVKDIIVGDRIVFERSLGIVRYVGEVQGYSGHWLGIEWDDQRRGKHNGTVDGVKYFECLKTEGTGASFIRYHKAKKTRTILSALHERYGYDEDAMASLRAIDDRIDKMRITYSELTLLDLSEKNVSDLGCPQDLANLCPNITDLCLAENFLYSWNDIAEFCRYFKLKRLDLSGNPIQPIKKKLENYADSFPVLEHLILGNVEHTWDDVLQALQIFPQLANLQVPYNKILQLDLPLTLPVNLTQLDLSMNHIKSWSEVLKLNVLQSLEYLNLCGNKIPSVFFPSNYEQPNNSYFSSLVRLNLTENLLQDWNSVNELNKLSGLRELRIDFNLFLEKESKANNREMIIAKIEKLKKLEGVEISTQERRDSELDYVKRFSSEWNFEGSRVGFLEVHPRYTYLLKKYGETDAAEISAPVKAMQIELITLEVIPEDASHKPCKKEFLPEMSVQKLRLYLKRLYKIKTTFLKLEIVSSRNPAVRFELSNDFLTLQQYSVEHLDKLMVSW